MLRTNSLLLVCLTFLIAGVCPARASSEVRVSGEWTLYSVDGRDFVAVDNIIGFYGLASTSILAGSARTTSPAARGLSLISEDQR
jgi:hypothetical protein